MELEELIRDAQRRQADRAVDPGRIRNALPRRAARNARHSRRRTGAFLIGATTLAAAVAIPVLLGRSGGNDAVSAGARPGTATTTAAGPGAVATPPATDSARFTGQVFKPTWVPSGLVERNRIVFGGGFTRSWRKASAGTSGATRLDLESRVADGANDPQANEGVAVSVGGKAGFYHPAVAGDDKSYVEWRATPTAVLSVTEVGLRLSKTDLVKVAASVQPDGSASFVPQPSFPLPAGLAWTSVEMSGTGPTHWTLSSYSSAPDTGASTPAESKKSHPTPTTLTVAFGSQTDAPAGGHSVTVAGHPGRVITVADSGPANLGGQTYVVVNVGPNRVETLTARGLTEPALLAVAATVPFPTPDLSWLH